MEYIKIITGLGGYGLRLFAPISAANTLLSEGNYLNKVVNGLSTPIEINKLVDKFTYITNLDKTIGGLSEIGNSIEKIDGLEKKITVLNKTLASNKALVNNVPNENTNLFTALSNIHENLINKTSTFIEDMATRNTRLKLDIDVTKEKFEIAKEANSLFKNFDLQKSIDIIQILNENISNTPISTGLAVVSVYASYAILGNYLKYYSRDFKGGFVERKFGDAHEYFNDKIR